MDVSPTRPFPELIGGDLGFVTALRNGSTFNHSVGLTVIPTPHDLPHIVHLPSRLANNGRRRIVLSTIVRRRVNRLFPNVGIANYRRFQLAHGTSLSLTSSISSVTGTLRNRLRGHHFNSGIQLRIAASYPAPVDSCLLGRFRLRSGRLCHIGNPIGLAHLLFSFGVPGLHCRPFARVIPGPFHHRLSGLSGDADVFSTVHGNSILMRRPFRTFSPVVGLL